MSDSNQNMQRCILACFRINRDFFDGVNFALVFRTLFVFVSYNMVPALEEVEVLFCLCYCQQCGGPSSLEEDYDLNDSGHWSNRIPGFKTLRDPEKQRKKEERRRIKEEVSCFFFIMITFHSIMP